MNMRGAPFGCPSQRTHISVHYPIFREDARFNKKIRQHNEIVMIVSGPHWPISDHDV
jgi:hypothetical protein